MTARPGTVPVLDTNETNRVAPAGSKQTDGYVLNDTLPASNANYLYGFSGDWLTWLDERTADGPVPLSDFSMIALAAVGASGLAGGAMAMTSGAGDGVGVGGALAATAGVGGATGAGGAVSMTGGVGGATSGVGGAASVTGGDAGATTGVGGAASITGGDATGANTGGASNVVGGVGGATGAGGIVAITGGVGGATSGAGGTASVTGGAATAGSSNGGSVFLQSGAGSAGGADGNVIIRTLAGAGSPGDIIFSADGAEAMRIDGAGDVVVGTGTAAAKLHVQIAASGASIGAGTEFLVENTSDTFINIATGTSDIGGILFADSGGSAGQITYEHTGDSMHFRAASVQIMMLDAGKGSIGTATSAPDADWEVTQSDTIGAAALLSDFSAGVGIKELSGNTFYSTLGFYGNQSSPIATLACHQTASGSLLVLATTTSFGSGMSNTGLVLDQTGQVGIGTDAESGAFSAMLQIDAVAARGIHVNTTTGTDHIRLSRSSATSADWSMTIDSAGTFMIRDQGTSNIPFRIEEASATDTMVIDTSGTSVAGRIEVVNSGTAMVRQEKTGSGARIYQQSISTSGQWDFEDITAATRPIRIGPITPTGMLTVELNGVAVGPLSGVGANEIFNVTANISTGFAATFVNQGDNVDRKGIVIRCGENVESGTNVFIECRDGAGANTGTLQTVGGALAIADPSDPRLKQHIAPTKIDAIDVVSKIDVIEFAFKKGGKEAPMHPVGFNADNMEEVFPYAVSRGPGEEGHKSIMKSLLIPLLVRAVQQLEAQVAELKKN